MECINIGLVTRGINEYGMREEGVTFYIGLYPTTITKARYYYIQRNRLRMDKMPHLKLVEQSNIEALHGATLTTESGLRCSMCQASLINSDKPLMYIWRLRVAHILPFCFTLGQVCFWISLWLWYPFSFSTQLTVNEERLCTLYIHQSSDSCSCVDHRVMRLDV